MLKRYAGKGIGNAIANAALKAGDFVVATTRKEHGFAISEQFKNNAINLTLDVSDTDENLYKSVVNKAVEKFGRIDILVNNAGYGAGPVPYHTSKFAVTGFSTSLAFEVKKFGIKVTNVAPGLFRTGFYDKGTWGTTPDIHIEDYDAGRWQTAFIENAQNHEQPGNPEKLAELLLEVASSETPSLHLDVGADALM